MPQTAPALRLEALRPVVRAAHRVRRPIHLLEQRTFARHTWTSTAANLRVLHQATALQLELDGA